MSPFLSSISVSASHGGTTRHSGANLRTHWVFRAMVAAELAVMGFFGLLWGAEKLCSLWLKVPGMLGAFVMWVCLHAVGCCGLLWAAVGCCGLLWAEVG